MGACASGHVLPFGYNSKRLTKEQIALVDKYLPDFCFLDVSTEAHLHIAAAHWNRVFAEVASGRSSTRTSGSSASTSGRQTASHPIKNQGNSKLAVLYDAFYAYLADSAPELQPVFRSSMHVRSKVLLHISAGMRNILSNQFVPERFVALTKTHMGFGVKLDFFNAQGKALLHAMHVASEELWTPEVEMAWRRLFAHCSAILMVHHKRYLERKRAQSAQQQQQEHKGRGPEIDDLQAIK